MDASHMLQQVNAALESDAKGAEKAPQVAVDMAHVEARRVALTALGRELQSTQAACAKLCDELRQAQLSASLFVVRAGQGFFGEVADAVKRVQDSTARFAMVVDLMVAVVQLLDEATFTMAHTCCRDHLQGCAQQLETARTAFAELQQMPRLRATAAS